MAVRLIVILGDPVLHAPTAPVPVAPDGSLPAELPALIADMYQTMDAANGVGLAANQIGVGLRLFVYDCADERGRAAHRRGAAQPRTSSNSRHSPFDMPELSWLTVSPLRRRRSTSIARADNVAPPSR